MIITMETMAEYRRFLITLSVRTFDEQAMTLIQKVGNRRCLPGSTLKGALRNSLEKYLIQVCAKMNSEGQECFRPCVPASRPSDNEQMEIQKQHYKTACRFDPDEPRQVCPVCYLYGAQGLVGFVNVPCLFELPNRPNVFGGEMAVLWEDRQKRWNFGESRLIGNRTIDPWTEDLAAESILESFVLKLTRSITRLGSKGRCNVEVRCE